MVLNEKFSTRQIKFNRGKNISMKGDGGLPMGMGYRTPIFTWGRLSSRDVHIFSRLESRSHRNIID